MPAEIFWGSWWYDTIDLLGAWMEFPISTTILQVQCPGIIRFVLGVTKRPDAGYKDATRPAHPKLTVSWLTSTILASKSSLPHGREDIPFTWRNPKKLRTVCDIICSLLSSCGNLNWYQLIIHPGRHLGSHLMWKTLMFNYFSNSNTLLPLTKTLHGKIRNT